MLVSLFGILFVLLFCSFRFSSDLLRLQLSRYTDRIENHFILQRRRWRLWRETTKAEIRWQQLSLPAILNNAQPHSVGLVLAAHHPPLISEQFLDEPVNPTDSEVLAT